MAAKKKDEKEIDAPPKLIEFRELRRGVNQGEEFEGLTEHLLKALGFETQKNGRGPDGGRDIICIQVVPGPFPEHRRRWLVQCKDFARRGSAVSEADVGSITDLCTKHECDGYLLVTTTIPTHELVKVMTAITAKKPNGLVAGYWDENFLRKQLEQPKLRHLLRTFLPESYKRLQSLEPVGLLLEQIKETGYSDAVVEKVRRVLADNAPKSGASERYFAGLTPRRREMDQAVEAFDEERIEATAELLETLPFEEWSELVSGLSKDHPDRTRRLLAIIAGQATEEDHRLAAARRLVDAPFNASLEDVLEHVENLGGESLEILAQDLGLLETVTEEVLSHGYEVAQEAMQDLPALTLENAWIEDIAFELTMEDGQPALRAVITGTVEVHLGQLEMDMSFPFEAKALVRSKEDIQVTGFTVNTASFFA